MTIEEALAVPNPGVCTYCGLTAAPGPNDPSDLIIPVDVRVLCPGDPSSSPSPTPPSPRVKFFHPLCTLSEINLHGGPGGPSKVGCIVIEGNHYFYPGVLNDPSESPA